LAFPVATFALEEDVMLFQNGQKFGLLFFFYVIAILRDDIKVCFLVVDCNQCLGDKHFIRGLVGFILCLAKVLRFWLLRETRFLFEYALGSPIVSGDHVHFTTTP